jgi:ferredoxin
VSHSLVDRKYLLAGGMIRLDSERCRGCLECEEICPTGVLVMPISGDQEGCALSVMGTCIVCRYCLTSCPDKALSLIPKADEESYP